MTIKEIIIEIKNTIQIIINKLLPNLIIIIFMYIVNC